MNNLTNEKILEIWKKIFPHSLMIIRKASLSEYYFYDGFLAENKTECSNGYLDNDMLNYRFEIDNNIYKEFCCSILTKPENNLYCYGRQKLRKKTIKNVTAEKLEKRFLQVKQLIIDNKDNLKNVMFNINDKI